MQKKFFNVNRISFIFLSLCLFVVFIPNFEAAETKHTHFVYLSIFNALFIPIFYFHQRNSNEKKFPISVKLYLFFFLGLFFLALCSSAWAINSNETFVSSLQLVTKINSIFLIFLALNSISEKQIFWLFKLIIVILMVENISVIQYFLDHNNFPRSGQLISKLRHNYSNINIMSASLVLKVPFAMFVMLYETKKIWRSIALFTISITFSATLFLSSRTGFYNLIIITILFFSYLLLLKREKKYLRLSVAFLFLIGLNVFFTLNINKVKTYRLNKIEQMFSPDFRAKGTISLKSDTNEDTEKKVFTGLSGREAYWVNALNTFKRAPLLGVGLGNWKLSSKDSMIESRRSIDISPYRVHNDFLEFMAELGVLGFILFTGVFILLFYIVIRVITAKKKKNQRDLFFCLFLGLLVYFSDSIFNFPSERPAVFTLFIFLSGFILFIGSKSFDIKENMHKGLKKIGFSALFLIAIVLLIYNWKLFSSSAFEYKFYSFKTTSYFFTNDKVDVNSEKNPTVSYHQIVDQLNSFPNQIGTDGNSLEIYKAIFARKEKNYEKAIDHYKKAIIQVPGYKRCINNIIWIYYNDLKNNDSALFYSKKQFNKYPFDNNSYITLRNIHKKNNDTIKVMQTISRFLKYSPKDVKNWMSKAYNYHYYYRDKKGALQILDSAIAMNPEKKKELKAYKKTFY